jgi:hypothetical protein
MAVLCRAFGHDWQTFTTKQYEPGQFARPIRVWVRQACRRCEQEREWVSPPNNEKGES